jgi:GMP synthase (glutamine-hydrolysing)
VCPWQNAVWLGRARPHRRLRRAVHAAHRAPRARAAGLLRDPPLHAPFDQLAPGAARDHPVGRPRERLRRGRAHRRPARIFELGVPVLGICYGLQLIAHLSAARSSRPRARVRRRARRRREEPESGSSAASRRARRSTCGCRHGDRIEPAARLLRPSASREHALLRRGQRARRRSTASSFTPRSSTRRAADPRAFLFDVAGLTRRGRRARSPRRPSPRCARPSAPASAPSAACRAGSTRRSRPSSATSALGDRLTCIFVDNGLLRQGEAEQVVATFRETSPQPRRGRRARALPHGAPGVTDPEQKRKIIGRVFIEVFEEEAEGRRRALPRPGHALPGRHRERLVQGAERRHQEPPQRRRPARAMKPRSSSRCASSSRTRCARPARRSACQRLLWRQPFPGPGLAIRCLGEVTRARLAVCARPTPS